MSAPPAPARRPRTRFRLDRFTSAWSVAAVVVAGLAITTRGVVPQTWWTAVHVVTLGVLTGSVLQWSWYFARALLHLPADDRRSGRDATVRMVVFQVALVALVASMWTAAVVGTVVAAGVIGAVIAWHGFALVQAARTRLGNRFAAVVRYYVAAAGFLVVGCVLAGFVTVAMFAAGAPAWLVDARDGLTAAHAVVNLGGWVGLSITGTLVTLGPTMLRTRIDPGALDAAVRALPVLVAALAVGSGSALLGWTPGVGLGVAAAGTTALVSVGFPLLRGARSAAAGAFGAWTLGAGLVWTAVGLTGYAVHAARAADVADLRTETMPWTVLVGAGGVLQVFVAALSYLMPVVIGGGPTVVRTGMTVLETAWPARVAARQTALALVIVGTVAGSGPLAAWWGVVLAGYAVDVALLARAGVRQARARGARTEPPPVPLPDPRNVVPSVVPGSMS